MKKRIMMLLLFLGVFVLGISSVKADIDITCGSEKCPDMDFSLVQLTSTNTKTDGAYSVYAEYFKSFYQSTPACINTADGCISLADKYNFSMDWSSSIDFTAYPSNKFNNLSDGIGTAASYTKAGTYAFLVGPEYARANTVAIFPDSTEYIVYVNVKSDLTIGSITAKRIRNSDGYNIPEEKVTELSYILNDIWPSYINGVYADFYITNDIVGEYADLTKPITYRLVYPENGGPFDGIIVDSNGKQKEIDYFLNNEVKFTLSKGDAFVIREGTMNLGSLSKGNVITVMPYQNVDGYTAKIDANGESVKELSGNATEITLGYYDNYVNYTWTYPLSNVPDTGVAMKVLSYVIIVVLLVIAIVLLILLSRKKESKKDKSNKK